MRKVATKSGYRVLVIGSRKVLPEKLPESVREFAEVSTTVRKALEMVSAKGYDAALCWVERNDELAGVIRIRKARPGLPIMVVTSRNDPDFAKLAQLAGATTTATSALDAGALSQEIGEALDSWDLAKEVREQARIAHTFAKEIRVLAQELQAQIEVGKRRLGAPGFTAVLVEDDPAQAQLMTQAFRKAGIKGILPIVKNHDELRDYLAGGGLAPRPYPSVILLNLELPGMSGFDVLRWIRTHPWYSRCPVVILSAAPDPAKIHQAYELGANSFLVKPAAFEDLVQVVTALYGYWGEANQKPEA